MRHYGWIVIGLGLLQIHCGQSSAGSTSSSGSNGNGTSTSASATGSTASSTGSSGTGSTSSNTIASSASSSSSGTSTLSTSGSSGGGSYHGIVSLSLTTTQLGSQHTIAAAFVDASSPIPIDLSDCTGGTVFGECCYRSNGGNSGSSGSSGSTTTGGNGNQYSAGVITLADGTSSLGTLTPNNNGSYPVVTNQTWNAGDTLSANAAGDVVHTFQGTVTAPTGVSITAPTGSGALGLASVSTSQPLLVSWSGAGGDKIYVVLTGLSGASLTCTCDLHGTNACKTSNTLTLQGAALANFAGQAGGLLGVAKANELQLTSNTDQVVLSSSTQTGLGVQFTQ